MSDNKKMQILAGNVPVVRAQVTFYVDLAVAASDCDEAVQEIADMGHLVQDLSVQGNSCEGLVEGVAYGLLEDELDTERVRVFSWGLVTTSRAVVAQTERSGAFPEAGSGDYDDE